MKKFLSVGATVALLSIISCKSKISDSRDTAALLDLNQTIVTECVDKNTISKDSKYQDVKLYVNGKEFNPCGGKVNSVKLTEATLGLGAGIKMYRFSNVATVKDVEFHMETLGLKEKFIKKNSSSIYQVIKSKLFKRIFFVFGLAEGGYGVYQLLKTDENSSTLVPVSILKKAEPQIRRETANQKSKHSRSADVD